MVDHPPGIDEMQTVAILMTPHKTTQRRTAALPAMQPRPSLRAVWIALALLLPATATQARIKTYPASVEIGMADAIVIGTAIRFHGRGDDDAPAVSFAVESHLRGFAPPDRLLVQLPQYSDLIDADSASGSRRCAKPVSASDQQRTLERVTVVSGSRISIRCRARYVLYLGCHAAGDCRLQRAFSTTDSARLDALRRLLPHVPAWGKSRRGLAAMLVTDTPRVAAGEDIELSFGLKNVGDAPLLLHFGGARDERSHFTLSLVGPDGERIAAQPHPELDADSLQHYFRHMSATGALRLEPGETHFLPAEPINSARGGWGYKEQLDFSYYPMPQRGRYRIVGTAHRFLRAAAPETRPLEIRVE